MNGIFLTQSGSLRVFYELMKAVREPLQLGKIGLYVADHTFYSAFRQQCPDIERGDFRLAKEWEITAQVERERPDLNLIRRYERDLGVPSLWGALVADRRIYLGKRCSFRQDYRPRFSHTQMLTVLERGLLEMERLFDEVQPDFVISFVCVTFGEYLAYLFARSRGIAFLNLRPTRIRNYVTYGSSIFEPSERIRTAYHRYLSDRPEDEWMQGAREYLASVETGHAMYEGVLVPTGARPPRASRRKPWRVAKLLWKECAFRLGKTRDNHNPGVLVPLLYKRFLNPLQAWWNDRRLSGGHVTESELRSLDYVFFPLHTEPEVTLLVYSKPYLNQIEVIRNVSHSLPVGMKLVVKEHPASVGKRPLSYYRKILEIPNVRLAAPRLSSRALVSNARLVATIAGSIGWEAILRRRPVVLFGHAPYEFLPPSMLRRVGHLEHLGDEIKDLLQSYCYQDNAVLAYVAATMSQSIAVNWYSRLLGRAGAYAEEPLIGGDETDFECDISALARYTVDSLRCR